MYDKAEVMIHILQTSKSATAFLTDGVPESLGGRGNSFSTGSLSLSLSMGTNNLILRRFARGDSEEKRKEMQRTKYQFSVGKIYRSPHNLRAVSKRWAERQERNSELEPCMPCIIIRCGRCGCIHYIEGVLE